jgi:ATP-dependent Clp protease ATP-binding subunit ClpC
VGLKNPNRPIASFIFAGPTGVGKSELAKTLANYYFGSEEAMVRRYPAMLSSCAV